jgi:hypothetical protein
MTIVGAGANTNVESGFWSQCDRAIDEIVLRHFPGLTTEQVYVVRWVVMTIADGLGDSPLVEVVARLKSQPDSPFKDKDELDITNVIHELCEARILDCQILWYSLDPYEQSEQKYTPEISIRLDDKVESEALEAMKGRLQSEMERCFPGRL